MIAVALVLGLLAGIAIGLVAIPRLARRPLVATATLREGDTSARSHALDELIEAMRAAALRVEIHPDGFDVLEQPPAFRDHRVAVRVSDRHATTLGALRVRDTGHYDLTFAVALALVPLYGAMTVTEADGGVFRVDGTQDQLALRQEKAARVTARLREIVSRMR